MRLRAALMIGTMLFGSCWSLAQDRPPLTKDEQRHQNDLKNDTELGAKYAEQVEKEQKLSDDKEGLERIERIGFKLAAIANETPVTVTWGDKRLNGFSYTFKLIKGKDVNAFSLPGGYIYVYEGLLKYAQSDDEIAGVLAHEIAHASLRHVAVLRSEASKIDLVTLPLILISIMSGKEAAMGASTVGQLIGQAIGSGWSVKAEEAADYAGLQYMLKSNFNPVGMLTFMERLGVDDRNKPTGDWGIYQTHPPSRERASFLTSKLAAAQIPIRRSEVTESFRTKVVAEKEGGVRLEFNKYSVITFRGTDAATRAASAAKAIDALMDEVPKLVDLRLSGLTVLGRNTRLFTVDESDLGPNDKSTQDVAQRALQGLKSAAYDLAYRVWNLN